MNPRTEPRLRIAIDAGERLFSVLLFTVFILRQWHSFAPKPYNTLAVISEGVLVAFMVFRRPARSLTFRPQDWLVALAGTTLPMLAMAGGKPLVPALTGTILMSAGLVFSLWAKLSIRRSFGLAAANRGVVMAGPYRWVRHPMYLGYAFVHLGYLLMNPLPWNAVLYACVWAFQVARILAEERLLNEDPAYSAFAGRVRFRLAPGLF